MKRSLFVVAITTLLACGDDAEQFPLTFGGKADDRGSSTKRYLEIQHREPGHGCNIPATDQTIQTIQQDQCLLVASTTKGDLVAVSTHRTAEIAAMDSARASGGIGTSAYALVTAAALAGLGLYELGAVAFGGVGVAAYVDRDMMNRGVQKFVDVAKEILGHSRALHSAGAVALAALFDAWDKILDPPQESINTRVKISAEDLVSAEQEVRQSDCSALNKVPPYVEVPPTGQAMAYVCVDDQTAIVRPLFFHSEVPVTLTLHNIGTLAVEIEVPYDVPTIPPAFLSYGRLPLTPGQTAVAQNIPVLLRSVDRPSLVSVDLKDMAIPTEIPLYLANFDTPPEARKSWL